VRQSFELVQGAAGVPGTGREGDGFGSTIACTDIDGDGRSAGVRRVAVTRGFTDGQVGNGVAGDITRLVRRREPWQWPIDLRGSKVGEQFGLGLRLLAAQALIDAGGVWISS
jgi:hypothetical protein